MNRIMTMLFILRTQLVFVMTVNQTVQKLNYIFVALAPDNSVMNALCRISIRFVTIVNELKSNFPIYGITLFARDNL